MRIVFMGTPEFAVPSLEILIKSNYNIVAVVTAPDKEAGRGKVLSQSAIKKYALSKNIIVLQPTNLKDEIFVNELKSFKADLQIVVAFRMLPEVVWNMPEHGTINLHGSLLPNYRGAAPINWAIINGEKETGVTTFLLKHEIDTGNIILNKKISITEKENAGSLHDKMMQVGAELLLETVKKLEENKITYIIQSELLNTNEKIKHAPKIFKENTVIDWNRSMDEVYNFIRGLSPYPTATTTLVNDQKIGFKIFESEKTDIPVNGKCGSIVTDGQKYIYVATNDFYISIKELQAAGKSKMNVENYLRGNKLNNQYYFG